MEESKTTVKPLPTEELVNNQTIEAALALLHTTMSRRKAFSRPCLAIL
jgi:hypothetical protein